MREIKFRYTCVRDNRYSFSRDFSLEEIESGIVDKWKKVNIISDGQLRKRQFTGREDSRGNEIYEGDVISKHKAGANYPLNYIVVFNETEVAFMLRWVGHKKQSGFYDEKISDNGCKVFEVIGNIYENPELINEPKELKK